MNSSYSSEDTITHLLFRMFRMIKKQLSGSHILHDLTLVQLQALTYVHDGQITMKELAEKMQITLPTLSVLVERLVQLKLVTREHDTTDRRSIHVKLTSEGERQYTLCQERKLQYMKQLFAPLSAADKKQLERLFQKLVDALEKEEVKHE